MNNTNYRCLYDDAECKHGLIIYSDLIDETSSFSCCILEFKNGNNVTLVFVRPKPLEGWLIHQKPLRNHLKDNMFVSFGRETLMSLGYYFLLFLMNNVMIHMISFSRVNMLLIGITFAIPVSFLSSLCTDSLKLFFFL